MWCQTSRVVTAEEEDTFVMMCRMSDPVLKGTVMCSRGSRSRSGFVELTGEKGQLLGSHTDGFALLVDGPERRPLSVGQDVPTVREALRAFVDSLLYGTEFPITPEEGLRAVAIAEACYRSADSGQAVAVER